MSDDKSTDAEEIFSEFQKKKAENEKPSEPEPEPEPQQSTPEPEPQQSTPEPEPQQSTPEPEPQQSTPEPEPQPQQSTPEPEPQQSTPEPEPAKEETSQSQELPAQESKSKDDDNVRRERDVIFVGIKPIMTYVTATLTQLSSQSTVTIKARGKRITQAVDVSQMIVKRMNSVGYVISDVRIASDSLLSQDGKQRNVSTMEIDVTKT